MSDTSNLTPQLNLQLLQPDNSAHHFFDRAIMQLDGMILGAIEDQDLTAPPGGETDGQLWLINGTGTGAWENHDNELALYYESFELVPPSNDPHTPWFFFTPYNGIRLWVKDENILITRNAGSWFEHVAIVNADGTLADLRTKLNLVLAALRGHGFLDVF